MRLLVVGGPTGQVARALNGLARPGLEVIARGRPEIDFEKPETLAAALEAYSPEAVASVGAYTAVDQAESDAAVAERINAIGPGVLAEACAARGLPIVHVSTDYVFDGTKTSPYVETDATSPTSVYGRTKLEGEQRVMAAGGRAVVLRVSWVYAPEGKNFVRTMLRLAKTRERVGVVDDQRGHPTYAPFIAGAVATIAERLVASKKAPTGLYHLAGDGVCSWFDFAGAVFEGSRARGGPAVFVEPIPSSAYPTPVKRPENSALDASKIAADYGVRLPPWRAGLDGCLDAIATGGWNVG
jgi:dTDP-4-dehydrorhamnose reductase